MGDAESPEYGGADCPGSLELPSLEEHRGVPNRVTLNYNCASHAGPKGATVFRV